MRGAVCVVHRTVGFSPFYTHLLHLVATYGLSLTMVEGTAIGAQREQAAQEALRSGADWLLWIDDDHIFPPQAVERLLHHNVPIVGGLYLTRRPPYKTTAMRRQEDGKLASLSPDDVREGRLLPVDVVGMGFTLVRREVFSIPQPWFAMGRMTVPGEACEDVWFCTQAKQHGFGVYVDTGLRIPHLTVAAVTLDADCQVRVVEPALAILEKEKIPVMLNADPAGLFAVGGRPCGDGSACGGSV